MSDLVCSDMLEFQRTLINTAREADESDRQSIRLAREKIKAIKAANPELAAQSGIKL